MKNNPVGWFEIYVKDMKRAKSFYEAVLKTEFKSMSDDPNFEMQAFPMDMTSLGAGGALVKMNGFEPGGNGVIIYFTSQDCSIEEKRVAEAGGKVQKPKTSIGEYGFISLAIDTEGNTFGLHSMK